MRMAMQFFECLVNNSFRHYSISNREKYVFRLEFEVSFYKLVDNFFPVHGFSLDFKLSLFIYPL